MRDGYINSCGDYVATYIVEMGRANDTSARFCIEIDAKCSYMAVIDAEHLRPGHIAFAVYRK